MVCSCVCTKRWNPWNPISLTERKKDFGACVLAILQEHFSNVIRILDNHAEISTAYPPPSPTPLDKHKHTHTHSIALSAAAHSGKERRLWECRDISRLGKWWVFVVSCWEMVWSRLHLELRGCGNYAACVTWPRWTALYRTTKALQGWYARNEK